VFAFSSYAGSNTGLQAALGREFLSRTWLARITTTVDLRMWIIFKPRIRGKHRFVTRSCITVIVCLVEMIAGWSQTAGANLSARDALARLMDGNQRYVRLKETHPDESSTRRRELVGGQHPFAVILGCADSRVPPELLFDQGLGDLFVIRVAGNIVDDAVFGSIEYAVEHLGTRLIVVLGHEKCGAVSAAIEGGEPAGHLKTLLQAIRPSVAATANTPGDKVHNCVIENVRRVASQIRRSEPVLKDAIDRKQLKVLAADYALDTGKVTLLDDRPSVKR
jgi:carbonic anhydrase